MGTPITLKTMKADTRDAVIDTLAKTWPLNARQVYSEVRDTQHLNITYQGVHKVLNQLVKEKIAVTQDRKYELDASWIKSLRKFAETADKNYSKSTSAPYLEIGTGSSVEKDAFTAGKEAAEKALKQIKSDKKMQLVLVFASGEYEKNYKELLKGIVSITRTAPLSGSTTIGEINNRSLHRTITVTVFCADDEIFRAVPIVLPITQSHYAENSFNDILSLLEKKAGFEKRFPDLGIVFFPGYKRDTGMKAIAPGFLTEFANRFSNAFPLIGGLAGSNWNFDPTVQFCNTERYDDAIIFVCIHTKLKIGVRRLHGYTPLTKHHFKVRTKEGAVTEMAVIEDGKIKGYEPALEVYVRETGLAPKELKKSLPTFIKELIAQNKTPPLTRVSDGAHGFPMVIEGNTIRFSNPFNEGDIAQISKTSPEEITETTKRVILEACREGNIRKPLGVLLNFCAAIKAIIDVHGINEIEKIRVGNLSTVPIFGCYNMGEIGPMAVPQGSGTVVALVFGNELRE